MLVVSVPISCFLSSTGIFFMILQGTQVSRYINLLGLISLIVGFTLIITTLYIIFFRKSYDKLNAKSIQKINDTIENKRIQSNMQKKSSKKAEKLVRAQMRLINKSIDKEISYTFSGNKLQRRINNNSKEINLKKGLMIAQGEVAFYMYRNKWSYFPSLKVIHILHGGDQVLIDRSLQFYADNGIEIKQIGELENQAR